VKFDVKFEAPEAMDEPLNPFIPEANEPLNPDVADRPLETHSPEAADAHIDHYIPAGILRKYSCTHLYPDSEIALLEKHEWIRTRSFSDGGNVQVFVLPEAQQKKPILRKRGDSEKTVRSALKLVMSMIDRSSEAWNGLAGARAGLHAKDQPDSEEESLYYIFNTLQEPALKLNHVTDLHSRNAMEELLGNSVRGLKTTLYEFQRESAAVMVQREAAPALTLDPRFQPWRGPTGSEFYYDKESGSILSYKILYPEACGGGYLYIRR
jgi:hypothetical protein